VAGKTVLLVDDEERLLVSTARLLEDHFNVITAGNGSLALDCLEKRRVDCIILDLDMPVMDGLTFLRRLRASGNYCHVIIVTGKSCLSYAEECAGLGVKGYIRKPYRIKELINKIKDLPGPRERRSKNRSRGLLHPKVRDSIKFIKKNYRYTISVKKAASQAGVSSDYLTLLFKKDLGLTVIQYINSFRVEKAKTLLKNRSLSISQIRERTGFTTEQNFYKQFKKYAGSTPQSYRSGMRSDEQTLPGDKA